MKANKKTPVKKSKKDPHYRAAHTIENPIAPDTLDKFIVYKNTPVKRMTLNEPSKVMRVPLSLVDVVTRMIKERVSKSM